jgi:hypothetical protein
VPGWRDLLDAPLEKICARQYVASNEAVLESRAYTDDARWVDVFYEELVARPTDEIRRLYTALDLPYTDEAEAFAAALPESVSTTSLTEPRADKWREQHGAEIERILPLVGATEDRLGY